MTVATEIVVPALGESVTTATVARWIRQPGESVKADEPLVELETDKVTVEVNAPSSGVLASVAVAEGTEVAVGALLGVVDAAGAAAAPAPGGVKAPPAPPGPVSRPATAPSQGAPSQGAPSQGAPASAAEPAHAPFPAAAKMMAEQQVDAGAV